MLKKVNKNCRNISILTGISRHSVFTRPPFLFFQHFQQYDTLVTVTPCAHKLKAGIAYWQDGVVIPEIALTVDGHHTSRHRLHRLGQNSRC
jgi:hypothetical protein